MVGALSIDPVMWIHVELARWWRVELAIDSEWPPWKQSGSRPSNEWGGFHESSRGDDVQSGLLPGDR